MQKKILAASVVLALASQGHAATWDTEFPATSFKAVVHTQQAIDGFAATEAGVIAPAGLLALGAEYAQNDLVTFTLSSAIRNNYAWPTSFKSIKTGTVGAGVLEVKATIAKTATALTVRKITGLGDADLDDAAKEGGKIVAGDLITCAADTTVQMRVKKVADEVATLVGEAGVACIAADDLLVVKKAQATFGLVSSDSTSATYRVSAIDIVASGTSTVGALVVTPAVQLLSTGLTANGAAGTTIAFSATTGAGTVMDSGGTATSAPLKIATAADDFVITVDKFNAVVDVEGSKLNFVGSASNASEDIVSFAIPTTVAVDGAQFVNTAGVLTEADAVTALATTVDAVVHDVTYSACFNFLDTNTATAAIDGLNTTGSATGMVVAEKAATSGCTLTATDATQILRADGKVAIKKVTATQVFPTGTFSGKSVFTWSNKAATPDATRTSTVTHADLGSWTLNGASVTVYGVPMASTVDRMIWITNKSADPAAVTATVTLNGTATADLALGDVAGNTTTSVDEAIDTALAAAGVTPPANSRAMIVLTSPIKAADMVVSASYKVTSANDRLSLETSDSLDDVITLSGGGTGSASVTQSTTAK
jgi:hypothetical protein